MTDKDQVDAAAKTYVDRSPLVDNLREIARLATTDTVISVVAPISIGDRTPGLVVDADGSVTIRMQVDDPGDDTVNWLPAPTGPCRPVLRAYQPTGGTLDGSYEPPRVRKLP